MILAMLFRRDQDERFLIPQYCKNNITEFVHDCSDRDHLGLVFALLLVVVTQNRILWLIGITITYGWTCADRRHQRIPLSESPVFRLGADVAGGRKGLETHAGLYRGGID